MADRMPPDGSTDLTQAERDLIQLLSWDNNQRGNTDPTLNITFPQDDTNFARGTSGNTLTITFSATNADQIVVAARKEDDRFTQLNPVGGFPAGTTSYAWDITGLEASDEWDISIFAINTTTGLVEEANINNFEISD